MEVGRPDQDEEKIGTKLRWQMGDNEDKMEETDTEGQSW